MKQIGKHSIYVIGVDPGKTGGAAYIRDGILKEVRAFKGEIQNCRTISHNTYPYLPEYFIEKVDSSPNQGRTSAFTFGKWAESVECAAFLSVGKDQVHMIRPAIWQNAIGVFSGGDKEKLYKHAQKLYPAEYKAKMFIKSTCDAVLIAYYGWRYMVHKGEG